MSYRTPTTYTVWFWREGRRSEATAQDEATGFGVYGAVQAATGEVPTVLTKEGRDFWTGRTVTYRFEVQKSGARS